MFFTENQQQLAAIERRQTLKRRNVERNVCARLARGSLSLQQGDYITQEDMDKVQRQMKEYFFSDRSKW
ncbi:MAG: hypothetical protein ACRC10_07660 [Thermoguttaceae bacterium]